MGGFRLELNRQVGGYTFAQCAIGIGDLSLDTECAGLGICGRCDVADLACYGLSGAPMPSRSWPISRSATAPTTIRGSSCTRVAQAPPIGR